MMPLACLPGEARRRQGIGEKFFWFFLFTKRTPCPYAFPDRQIQDGAGTGEQKERLRIGAAVPQMGHHRLLRGLVQALFDHVDDQDDGATLNAEEERGQRVRPVPGDGSRGGRLSRIAEFGIGWRIRGWIASWGLG